MPLDYLRPISQRHRRRRCFGHVEKNIHPDRKIRAVQESGALLLHKFTDIVQSRTPAGGANHHAFPRTRAGFNILDRRRRRGEINDHIDAGKPLFRQRGSIRVFRAAHRAHIVAALLGDLSNQRAGLALSQHQDLHFAASPKISGSGSLKKARCRLSIALGTSSSSITKLIFISDAPCEIMRTFMSGIAPKTLAAMPRVPRIFSPTRHTIALRPSYFTSASCFRSAAIAGIDSFESTVSETLTSDVET